MDFEVPFLSIEEKATWHLAERHLASGTRTQDLF
jgi:hypothetical protein